MGGSDYFFTGIQSVNALPEHVARKYVAALLSAASVGISEANDVQQIGRDG